MTKRGRGRYIGAVLGIVAFVLAMACGTATRADIVIEGDDWDKFQQLVEPDQTIHEQIKTPTTVDGRKSLHFTLPFGDKYALYELNVTQMPAGVNRFPIVVDARMVTRRDSGFAIRNLSIDDTEDPEFQNSFVAVGISHRGRGGARDDLFETDLEETVGVVGDRERNPTVDTTITPSGLARTTNATLELLPGANLLRLDTTEPGALPIYNPEGGYQVFSITIGPDQPELQGELVPVCTVRREISPKEYAAGEITTVTLTTRNITGPTTITDTLPDGWTLVGDGVGPGNTVALDVDAGASSKTVSYQAVAGDNCAQVTFSGSFAGDCAGDVSGTGILNCLHTGGIRITGSDWESFIEASEAVFGDEENLDAETEIIETEDGRASLNFDDNADYAHYYVYVQSLPAGKSRFPVKVTSRQTGDNSTSMAIRNLTIDPADAEDFVENTEDISVVQDSFVSIRLMDNLSAEARDERYVGGVEGEDPRDLVRRSGTRRDGAEHSTLVFSEGVSESELATLELVQGVNILRVDGTDVRDLPEYDTDTSHQIFDIIIGPDEPELVGGVGPGPFLRGDCNADGVCDLSDGVAMLNFAFLGAETPGCLAACDFNRSGATDVTTAVYFFSAKFAGGAAIPAPTSCAVSITKSDIELGCANPTCD